MMTERYQQFLLKMDTMQDHFSGRPPTVANDRITFWLNPNTAPGVIDHLAYRLAGKVEAAVSLAYGESYQPVFELDKGDIAPQRDDNLIGFYHNPYNTIVEPAKTEWSLTQYFRHNWQPKLGPLHTMIVRELRQRCHFESRRDNFKTTYKNLAESLGVSESTIKRALKRDKNGGFVHPYIGLFIRNIYTVKVKTDNGIRNEATRFVIALDDPLTDEDSRLMASEPKGQIDT